MAAHKALNAEQKEKVAKWRKSWVKIGDTQKKANLDAGKRAKEGKDAIVEAVERMGISPTAFRAEMKMLDHIDKAKGIRGKLGDEETVDDFDKLTVALEDQLNLDLFGPEPEKKTKKDKSTDDGKVTDLASRREAQEPVGAVTG